MRRSQLKSCTDFIETLTPNTQSLNNSLTQADFNHTILRLNDIDLLDMSKSSRDTSLALASEVDYQTLLTGEKSSDSDDELDENPARPFDIIIYDQKLLPTLKEMPHNLAPGLGKDLKHIIFLLFLYFLQGIYA